MLHVQVIIVKSRQKQAECRLFFLGAYGGNKPTAMHDSVTHGTSPRPPQSFEDLIRALRIGIVGRGKWCRQGDGAALVLLGQAVWQRERPLPCTPNVQLLVLGDQMRMVITTVAARQVLLTHSLGGNAQTCNGIDCGCPPRVSKRPLGT